jgi:hypothetical protein
MVGQFFCFSVALCVVVAAATAAAVVVAATAAPCVVCTMHVNSHRQSVGIE